MSRQASFQTRARAIDHLGRGQIADAPTAISELWKNAYDAYARDVALDIYEGDTNIAAIIDNGCGMSIDEFLSSWLVIGTESKAQHAKSRDALFGLPKRETQGEKGIGRLSTAFLAPVTLVVTKKVNTPYTAALIDWRFFENPYLNIADIEFPIKEFNNLKDLLTIAPEMFDNLKRTNLAWDTIEDPHRRTRLQGAWSSFSMLEEEQGSKQTTLSKLTSFDGSTIFQGKHLANWNNLMKSTPEIENHGTALFGIAPYHEIDCLVTHEYEDEDRSAVQENLRQTLTGFTDPFCTPSIKFNYHVKLYQQGKAEHTFLDSNTFLGKDFLTSLEHWVIGEFDERGVFKGQICAFGKLLGTKEIYPKNLTDIASPTSVGAFKFCIGSYEGNISQSTHSAEEHSSLKEISKLYGGVTVYRDNLRVMPYGREGADLFEIEFRRSKNAGRYFFSHRRSFGRMAFTRDHNPNLKDKAGREGLVDNKARRMMQRLVENLLIEIADRFFGSNSELRKIEIPLIEKKYKRQKKALRQSRSRGTKNYKKSLLEFTSTISIVKEHTKKTEKKLKEAIANCDNYLIEELKENIAQLEDDKNELSLGKLPKQLNDFIEEYREYRDDFHELTSMLQDLEKTIKAYEIKAPVGDQTKILEKKFNLNRLRLSKLVSSKVKIISNKLNIIKKNWNEEAAEDKTAYQKKALSFIEPSQNKTSFEEKLNLLDCEYHELRENFDLKYSSLVNTLTQLAEGIDVDNAFSLADSEHHELEEKISLLHSVAQLGVTVEIIGHELHDLESQVTRYMSRLPKAARELKSFQLAYNAHLALIDRLRFLTPMRITAYRSRTSISGEDIKKYVEDFFNDIFAQNRIYFSVSKSFKELSITDFPSRIYPTFINLINNAIYWVQRSSERKIQIDYREGKVIIADTGPGVDPDDLSHLFELFFSRRANGRGVGLYLCKQNLAVAHHKIYYLTDDNSKILSGANFIIEFKGASNA